MKRKALRIVALVMSVIMILGAMTIVSFANDGTNATAEYKHETDAKKIATQDGRFMAGYGFDAVNFNEVQPSSVTVTFTINAPLSSNPEGPGYGFISVYITDKAGNSGYCTLGWDNSIVKSINDQLGTVSFTISKDSFTFSPWIDYTQINRIDFDFAVNRDAVYALEEVKFDDFSVKNLGVVSMVQSAKDDCVSAVDGNNVSFSFAEPVDMSGQTTLSYWRSYINTSGTASVPELIRYRIALTDATGKIYILLAKDWNTTCSHEITKFSNVDELGDQFTVDISADAAAAIGFDLKNVVQIDVYFQQNKKCSVKIHRWELGGKLLSAANSDIYYSAPTDADLAFTAYGTASNTDEAFESEAFEFNAIDLAKYPKLKVNFTPINTSEGANSKIVEGPYMYDLYYTLTSSDGDSVTIDSNKKAVGDLNGSQMETIAISGLEDVVSITVTVLGNRELSAYYFNFSFVNGEGVEKATVTASQNILMVGHQRSTEITNNKMGLRFVAAVENIEGYTEIGFDVASTGKETASVSGKSVYTSVLGEDRTYYALDNYGYNYLYALEITNIDTTLGTLEFEVTPWAMVNGEKVTFASMTVIYNGATCVE